MIYIVGHAFQYTSRPRPQSSGSIQEQIAVNRSMSRQKAPAGIDIRFILGHKYRVARIYKKPSNPDKVCYLFADLTEPSQVDIEMLFPDTTKGDEYIAALSGSSADLVDIRNSIAASLSNTSDI